MPQHYLKFEPVERRHKYNYIDLIINTHELKLKILNYVAELNKKGNGIFYLFKKKYTYFFFIKKFSYLDD